MGRASSELASRDLASTGIASTGIASTGIASTAASIFELMSSKTGDFAPDALVREARDTGHSCIFIAHNIHHVFQVVSRIIVMRRGRIVADDIDPKQTTIEEVERVITGEEILEAVEG